jgi:hypothetical protein
MNEEKIKAANMAAFKAAVAPMQVVQEGRHIFVKDEDARDRFISCTTIKKVMSACCLYGFAGFYITDSIKDGLVFKIY